MVGSGDIPKAIIFPLMFWVEFRSNKKIPAKEVPKFLSFLDNHLVVMQFNGKTHSSKLLRKMRIKELSMRIKELPYEKTKKNLHPSTIHAAFLPQPSPPAFRLGIQDWCCHRENRGCVKFHCSGEESSYHMWAEDKRSWCCSNFQKACPRTDDGVRE